MALFSKKKDTVELPHTEIEESQLGELRNRAGSTFLPDHIRQEIDKEIKKIEQTDPSMFEYSLGIQYVDFVLNLPWGVSSPDNLDLNHAKAVLDQDHYGLASVKERILEYLAYNICCQLRRKLVLVIDHDNGFAEQVAASLVALPCDTVHLRNDAEAVSLLAAKHVDCIFFDWHPHLGNGGDFLKQAKDRWPDIPIVATTSTATVNGAVEALRAGAANYLAKPVDSQTILKTITDLLGQTNQTCAVSGPTLCFTGPPGTGKTSIGRSIANALQRQFIRLSLAGMRDEAELRGHRRTYVGAMAGRIITEISKYGFNNPVIMLDEVDKIGQDFRGDPASVLLEILDPEQNRHFLDYYLDLPFDLTQVMFITTANSPENLPGPLQDRMEMVAFSSYTLGEKRRIAVDYLFPNHLRSTPYTPKDIILKPEAVDTIILEYARGAGLRNLNREIGAICRKINLQIMEKKVEPPVSIESNVVRELLGRPKFRLEAAAARALPGVTTGLVWSESGGHIIFIETARMQGSGKLIMTGSLGDILKESAQTALSYLRSNGAAFGIDEGFFEESDIHVHIPAGAVSKDGPSAGMTIAMALISLLTGRPARRDVALTGEFTLSGRILQVSGLREKVLAAQQAGVRIAILPSRNRDEIESFDSEVREAVQVIFVDSIREAVDIVLL